MERSPIEIPEPCTSKASCNAPPSPCSTLCQNGYPLSPALSVDSNQHSIFKSPRGLWPNPAWPVKGQMTQASLPKKAHRNIDGQTCSISCQQFPKSPTGHCLQRIHCSVMPSAQAPSTEMSNFNRTAPDSCGDGSTEACWQQLPSTDTEAHEAPHVLLGRSSDSSTSRVPETSRDCCSAPSTFRSGAEMLTTYEGVPYSFREGEKVLVRCNRNKWLVGQVLRRLGFPFVCLPASWR